MIRKQYITPAEKVVDFGPEYNVCLGVGSAITEDSTMLVKGNNWDDDLWGESTEDTKSTSSKGVWQEW